MKRMERSSLWKSFWKQKFSKLLIRRKLFRYWERVNCVLGFFLPFFFPLFISFSEYHLISCVCLTLHFMSISVFPLSNFVCFVIVKDLKQEIEALKEEIGNIQLEKAQQVKIPEP